MIKAKADKSKGEQISAWLKKPVDPYVLGGFRIIFGLFMTYLIIHYFEIGLIRNMYVLPHINFQYDYLRWLKPLPELYLNLILGLIGICAVAISAGIFFKWACRFFAAGLAYFFLLDKSIYNNHIYLFILLALLLSFTHADRFLSLKKKGIVTPASIPRWQMLILQMQIVIVYFYGGIAKLTSDWLLHCQPVKTIVDRMPDDHILSPIIKHDVGIYLLNYGGLLIDLGAPLLLWYKPIRIWGVLAYVVFNGMNSQIFSDIGIFPFVMLGSLILFFQADEIPYLNKILAKAKSAMKQKNKIGTEAAQSGIKDTIPVFIYVYFCFQLLFPLRGHFLPNPLDWTTIGNHFSWRMKVDTRSIEEMNFTIHSPQYEQPVPVDIHTFINDMQILNLSMDPRSVADFAGFLKDEAIRYNTQNPQIKASIKLKYNGKPPQFFVEPNIDLATVTYSPFKRIPWVYPVPR